MLDELKTRRDALSSLAVLLLAILTLLPIVDRLVTPDGWGQELIVVAVVDSVLLLATVSYASWNRIHWESFLHPEHHMLSALASLLSAIGLAALELPLFFVLFGLTYMVDDPPWYQTLASELVVGAMLAIVALAAVALARMLVLPVLSVCERLGVVTTNERTWQPAPGSPDDTFPWEHPKERKQPETQWPDGSESPEISSPYSPAEATGTTYNSWPGEWVPVASLSTQGKETSANSAFECSAQTRSLIQDRPVCGLVIPRDDGTCPGCRISVAPPQAI